MVVWPQLWGDIVHIKESEKSVHDISWVSGFKAAAALLKKPI